ncbi:MAG: hypothetical protein AABX51_01680 [Nanoarchaeota archaeon]
MEKVDYIKALRIPLILIIFQIILTYVLSWFTFKNATSYEQIIAAEASITIYSRLIMIFSYAIVYYTGWIVVSKFKGNIKNSIFAGLIIGCIEIVLSFINIILMYNTIPGYKIGLSPIFGLGELGIIAFVGILIGLLFTLAINAGVAALGGFISLKVNKK